MQSKYQTIYETSYGVIKAIFDEEMTFEMAEKLGKRYCKTNGFIYVKTEKAIK